MPDNPHITTPAEFAADMRDIFKCAEDTVEQHEEADELLCRMLTALGYGEGAEIFLSEERYYT